MLKAEGYETCLVYVGTDNLAINMERVKTRVLKGGHDVPLEDQVRRYPRSYKNLPRAFALADEGAVLDNSTDLGHRIIAIKREGKGISL